MIYKNTIVNCAVYIRPVSLQARAPGHLETHLSQCLTDNIEISLTQGCRWQWRGLHQARILVTGDRVVKQKINKLSNSVHSLPSVQLKMKTQLFNLSSLNNNSKINEKYNNLEFAS